MDQALGAIWPMRCKNATLNQFRGRFNGYYMLQWGQIWEFPMGFNPFVWSENLYILGCSYFSSSFPAGLLFFLSFWFLGKDIENLNISCRLISVVGWLVLSICNFSLFYKINVCYIMLWLLTGHFNVIVLTISASQHFSCWHTIKIKSLLFNLGHLCCGTSCVPNLLYLCSSHILSCVSVVVGQGLECPFHAVAYQWIRDSHVVAD